MQSNTTPTTDLERYYECLYMRSVSKPGSEQEQFWSRRVKELEWVTELHPKH